MKMLRFELATEKEVYSRTARKEQEIRNRLRQVEAGLVTELATLQHWIRDYRNIKAELQADIQRLSDLKASLANEEPVKTILSLEAQVESLSSSVRRADSHAAAASRAARSASDAAYRAQRKAINAEYEARKDFWDRL